VALSGGLTSSVSILEENSLQFKLEYVTISNNFKTTKIDFLPHLIGDFQFSSSQTAFFEN